MSNDSKWKEILGEIFKTKTITQTRFAEHCGNTPGSVNSWCTGRVVPADRYHATIEKIHRLVREGISKKDLESALRKIPRPETRNVKSTGIVFGGKNKKKMNWSKIVKDVLGKHLLSQFELSEVCDVSQQTVSSWKIGTRIPGYMHQRKLLELYNANSTVGGETVNAALKVPVRALSDLDESFEVNPEKELLSQFRDLSFQRKRAVFEAARMHLMDEQLVSQLNAATRRAEVLTDIMDSLPDIVWCAEYDKQHIFKTVYMSPEFERISGYPPKDHSPIDDGWAGVVHPEDRSAFVSFSFNVIQNRLNDAVFDYRIVNPDGRVIKLRDKRRVVSCGDNRWRISGILFVLM